MKLQAVTNTVHNLRPGDIIEIRTGKKSVEHIKIVRRPEYNMVHDRWYVGGYRFIKSRNVFSRTQLLHNFKREDLVAYEMA